MRKAVAITLLLLAAVALALAPQPPAVDPVTGKPVGPVQPHHLMGKTPQPPDQSHVEWLNSQAPWAETDAQWQDTVRLTNNTVSDYTSYSPGKAVAVDPSGRVHVVWYSYRTPGSYSPQIYYKRWYPGTGWTTDTCISTDIASIGYCYEPSIAVDSSGYVHVVWYVYKVTSPSGYYVAYKRCIPTSSGNGGWDVSSTRISEDTLLWYRYYPTVACTPNGNVHVVWYTYYSTIGYRIDYKERTSAGWQPRVTLDSGSTSMYMWNPDVAGGRDNNVHVCWYGYAPGQTTYYQVWYRGRFAGSWIARQNVSKWSYYCYYPTIAVNPTNNRAAVAYYTYTMPNYWYLLAFKQRLGSTSTDTWPNAYENVLGADTLLYFFHPVLAFTKNGRAHIVWSGYPSYGTYYYAIRHNERSPAGVWETPYTVLYIPNYYQYYPSCNNGGNGSDSLSVHVVWYSSHNSEIYYRKGLPPSPYDLAMYRIDVPGSLHEVGENVNPSVWVRNVGTASVSDFSVKLDIGTAYSSTVTVNQTLAPGDTYNVTGFTTWTPSTPGNYAVRCSVRLTGDGNPNNDRMTKTTLVASFVERFTASNGNFRGTGGWDWGQPSGGSRTPPPSQPNCWGNKLSGYYANNANDTLLSFNLVATADTPVVLFQHWMYCETYWDGGNFKYSTDGGQTWTLLYPDGTRSYYGSIVGLGEQGYSGSWNWEVARFKIPVSNGTNFRVHWRFGSDGSVNYDGGWLIDDVAGIGCRKPIDVAATAILAPTGSIPYGVAVTPQVKVFNFGYGTQTFPVEFRIGTVYADTQVVSSLAPGDSAIVSFAPWTPTAKGSYQTSATTMLNGDEVPGNNTVTGTVDVYLIDVQPTAIVRPVGEVDSGQTVSPQVRVRNNGSSTVSFYVQLQIGSSYNQQRLVVGLTPDEERLITGFPNWTANQLGDFEVRCSTRLTGDMIPANDLMVDTVRVHKYDVATTEITVPSGNLNRGAVITPTAKFANYGDLVANADVYYVIYNEAMTPVYQSTASVTIDPGAVVEQAFSPQWTADVTGNYLAVAYIVGSRDNNRNNDTVQVSFTVKVPYEAGWKEMASILGEVKDGGFVAKDLEGGRIYAARGNKSADFYSYDPETDAWTTLAPAPAPIGKGGSGCYGPGFIYVMHGQNTPKFSRYNIATGAWEALPDIPNWTSGKPPKGGGDLVYAEVESVPYIYLLKGNKQDFGRYNLVTGTWEELPQAPAGTKPKWDKGSWLVFDGVTTIYAHKAKYSELHLFDVVSGQWTQQLPGIPTSSQQTGKNKKSKDGSDGAFYNGYIYALKGGNTVEFWRYSVAGNAWTELTPMPEQGSTGKKKRVKAGGSLTSNGDGAFFALKGGKTKEFWRFFDDQAVFAAAPERSGVMGQTVTPVRFSFRVAPNPLVKGYGLLTYSVPQAGEAKVKVFDVTGRTVAEFGFVAKGTGTKSLDLRQLPAGIYLVKFEAAGQSAAQKLIVQ